MVGLGGPTTDPLRWLAALFTLCAASVPMRAGGAAPVPEEIPAEEAVDFTGLPVMFYSPESGLALAGVGILHFPMYAAPYIRTTLSHTRLSIGYTTRDQLGIELVPELFFDREGDVRFEADATARRAEENYYGIGNSTALENEEIILKRYVSLRVSLQHRVYEKLYAGLLYDFMLADVDAPNDSLLFRTRPLGFSGALTSAPGISITWDGRDRRFDPHGGTYVELDVLHQSDTYASDGRGIWIQHDVRQYASIHDVRFAFEFTGEHITGRLPFDRLPRLGGTALLRGIHRGRYRDNNALAAQAELRFPIWWRLRGTAFFGAGHVAPEFAKLFQSHLHATGGGGLRVVLDRDKGINARVDVGFSRDDFGFYLDLGEAF